MKIDQILVVQFAYQNKVQIRMTLALKYDNYLKTN